MRWWQHNRKALALLSAILQLHRHGSLQKQQQRLSQTRVYSIVHKDAFCPFSVKMSLTVRTVDHFAQNLWAKLQTPDRTRSRQVASMCKGCDTVAVCSIAVVGCQQYSIQQVYIGDLTGLWLLEVGLESLFEIRSQMLANFQSKLSQQSPRVK